MRQNKLTIDTHPSSKNVLATQCGNKSPLSATLLSHRQVTVIEMGGFHSTMMPVSKGEDLIGGAAYVADAITAMRQKTDPVLISNGDVFTGQTSSLESGGNLVIQFMNQLNFDAMTLGIHDFDEGQEVLASRAQEAKFPILAANLALAKENLHISETKHPLSIVKPYITLVRGMHTIAVFGMMKEETPMFQRPHNILGLAFWGARETISRWLPDLLKEKPNIIVIQYNKTTEAEELALLINEKIRESMIKEGRQIMPLLVFIGGHLEEKPVHGPNYLVMQGTDRGYRLGVIKIRQSFRRKRFCPEYTAISAKKYFPDPRISQLVQEVKKRIEMQDVLLGYSKKDLKRAKYEDCPLGILITEAMKLYAKSEIAFLSSGTLKLDIDAGEIYGSDIDEAIPFKDAIILMELKGSNILNILEQSAKLESDSGGSGGKIMQVSGVRFRYNIKLDKGKRVSDINVNGEPLDLNRTYLAAVGKYLIDGGDGYYQFNEGKELQNAGDLKAVVKEYIKNSGTLDIQRDMRIEYNE